MGALQWGQPEDRPTDDVRMRHPVFCCVQDGLYPLLLRFTDAAADSEQIADMALRLLDHLPTFPALSQSLAAALDGPGQCCRGRVRPA